ncbi:MAG: bifunctional glycosyltransferase family 2/GtrA family protein [Acidimicrobiales bacterium]
MEQWADPRPPQPDPEPPQVDVVVPVYNEETDLEASILRLHAYLTGALPFRFRITVADNASTDGTWAIARSLAHRLPHVVAVHLAEKGRGRALRQVWSTSDAAVLAYMDVDLSTDLAALLPLVAPLVSGHSDLAIGTRLARGARVVRGTKREVISRLYNLLLHATLAARFSDAQCGFKAIRADRARALLPLVQDTGWFFDTELLFLAERAGMRIAEVPVDWVDDPDSRVDVLDTALGDLRGVARLVRGVVSGRLPLATLRQSTEAERAVRAPAGLVGQLARFCAVGVASTVAYVVLYVLLRQGIGAQPANALALLVTAVANTAVNRRVTFGVRTRASHARHQAQGLVVFGVGLALTSGALALLHATAPAAGRAAEVVVLVAANVAATVVRFVLFRSWVFHRSTPRPPAVAPPTPRSA